MYVRGCQVMNTTRQDAWTKDEDTLLAETVLRFIREGRTQLEAFKEVANKLSRTAAACGFRWNATIRKQYHEAIQLAKESRKRNQKQANVEIDPKDYSTEDPIDTAILLLKKMKVDAPAQNVQLNEEEIEKLKEENKLLKKKIKRYEEAWKEMGKVWRWIKKEDPNFN